MKSTQKKEAQLKKQIRKPSSTKEFFTPSSEMPNPAMKLCLFSGAGKGEMFLYMHRLVSLAQISPYTFKS